MPHDVCGLYTCPMCMPIYTALPHTIYLWHPTQKGPPIQIKTGCDPNINVKCIVCCQRSQTESINLNHLKGWNHSSRVECWSGVHVNSFDRAICKTTSDLFLLLIGDESHINYSQPGIYLSPRCKSRVCNITYKTVRIHICQTVHTHTQWWKAAKVQKTSLKSNKRDQEEWAEKVS